MKKFFSLHWQELLLAVFIFIAAILRFSGIEKLHFFTYDQARDALFVKRMIVDHEFRLLGTQTSLPGMYLPPFYFYTIAPVLWFSGLNPVGIDIYSALIGVLTVPLVFFVGNRVFGRPAGVFSAGLFSVSPIVVELTRRAWNPNTLPFFILAVFYFVYRYFKNNKTTDFLLAFALYGYSLSLHFGAWTLGPLFFLIWIRHGIKNRDWKGLAFSVLILLFFISPILLFELRHNFFLFGQAKVFFFDGGHVGAKNSSLVEPFLASLTALFTILVSGKISVGYGAPLEFGRKLKDLLFFSHPISVVAQKPFSLSFEWWGLALFTLITIYSWYFLIKKRLPHVLIWIWIGWGIFASLLYSGKFFFFYYLYLFPAPILLFGWLFERLWVRKALRPLSIFVLGTIVFFHLKHSTVFGYGWREIGDLRSVAATISDNVDSIEKFNLATIQRDADRWDRNAVDYRYFVEAFYNRRALDWYPENYKQAETLFVIDETGQGEPLASNIMEIEAFEPGEILDQWQLESGIKIYKLSKRTDDDNRN